MQATIDSRIYFRYNRVYTHVSRFISSRFISITRYPGSQHTDFQPSNIYYVEPGSGGAAQKNARLFTFIDIGGMGAPVMESDKDHFIKSAASTDSIRFCYDPEFLLAAHGGLDFRQSFGTR